jgi:maleate isomerase
MGAHLGLASSPKGTEVKDVAFTHESVTRTLGWVYPDVVDRVHQDFFRMLPPDVDLVIATRMWSSSMMHAGRFDRIAFQQHREDIIAAAVELGAYQDGAVDYIMVSGDLIQGAMGPAWDRELSRAIAAAANRPATTAMTALADSLTALEVDDVAVVTPFRDDQNEHLENYLVAAGFNVTALLGMQTNTTNEIRQLPSDSAHELAVRAVESDDRAQCVYIACPVWRGVTESIAPLERRLGVPVVTTVSAILWRALSTLTHPWHGARCGRLLTSLGPQAAPASAEQR